MKISAVVTALSLLSAAAPSVMATGCFENARHFHPDDWTHCQPISEDIFVYYTPFEEEGTVMLGLHVAHDSFGWSALALAGNGGMKGASQMVVRRDDAGDWTVEDRHSEDYVTPALLEEPRVRLLFANQTLAGETSWGVLVPMTACDSYHYPIQDKKMYLHWALGEDHSFSFHGNRRGQFHANLLQPPKELPGTDGLEHIDMQMPNVPVVLGEEGSDPTNPYICSMFDLEELSNGRYGAGETVHITRFSPILDKSKYVHHMILYACSGDDDDNDKAHLQVTPECESMPRGCREMKWAWALGAGDTMFPPDVGMPVARGQRWLVLQMHYFNANLDQQVTDSSGVRAFFTTDLREQEAGVLQLNGGVSAWQRPDIPSGVLGYQLAPFVLPHACTADQWTQPLNIIAVGHHMHLHGMKMSIDVERDGKNMGSLRNEHRYDFKHQSMDEPNPALPSLLPGDQITTKCTYDTSASAQAISFGDMTQQEMCISVILYYPRQEKRDSFGYMAPRANVTQCLSPAAAATSAVTTSTTRAGGDEDGWFVANNASLCAQELYKSVPNALGYGNRVPLDFGLLEGCNGGGGLYSLLLDRVKGICPAVCQANSNCTEEEIAEHAQSFCRNHCQSNLNVSLYPDLTATEPYDTGIYGCGELRGFYTPTPLEPEACQVSGNNLDQVIQLQPVRSSSSPSGVSFIVSLFVVGVVTLLL